MTLEQLVDLKDRLMATGFFENSELRYSEGTGIDGAGSVRLNITGSETEHFSSAYCVYSIDFTVSDLPSDSRKHKVCTKIYEQWLEEIGEGE